METDYKQKFEKALGFLRNICHAEVVSISEIKKAFPEIDASEEDMMRNALLELVHDTTSETLSSYGINKLDALAWLEQNKQNGASWSEEDEKKIRFIHDELFQRMIGFESGCAHYQKLVDALFWLKNIKPAQPNKP